MFGRLLARLLHYANASPPTVARQEFYAFKRQLLLKHAHFLGHDLQVITKECWGRYDGWDDTWAGCMKTDSQTGRVCPKCGGSGIFDQRWIRLEHWRWHGFTFHCPAGDTRIRPDSPPSSWIHGRIEHPNYGRWSDEARLWLYLLTGEWRLLWRDLSGHCYCSPGLFPMLRLQKVTLWLRMKLSRQTCYQCGRRFMTWGNGWLVCRRCRRARYLAKEMDEIPF